MIIKDKVINFLGDSITEGAGTSGPENRYFEVMKRQYGLKEVNGYGIGGTRIAKQKTPSDVAIYDAWFASRVDDMTDNADIVVVFGGTNDFGHGDAPLGDFSDRTPDTFYGACHDLYLKLINKYPDKTIVIMTPLHRENEYCLRGERKMTDVAPLVTYVDIIREVAQYYSLPVCDLYSNSGLQPEVPIIKEKYVPDGLHPNDDGNKIIAERLGNFLLSL